MIHIKSKHVRLSEKARKIFEDKKLGDEIILSISCHGRDINAGKSIAVGSVIISSATNKNII